MTRLIINGFFRSGTTILWHALARAQGADRVLYEPCHPDLCELAAQAPQMTAHPIHGLHIWDGYTPHLKRLGPLHSAYREACDQDIFCRKPNAAASYAQGLFQALDAQALQVNRWHFVLDAVAEATGARLIHVLRNPYDILRSFRRIFQNSRPPALCRVLRKVAPGYLPPQSWDMLLALQERREHLSEPAARLARSHPLLSRQGADIFLAVWLQSNAVAVQSTLARGGQVFWIEQIVTDPQSFVLACQAAGLEVDQTPFDPAKVSAPMGPKQIALLRSDAQRLGMAADGDAILRILANETKARAWAP